MSIVSKRWRIAPRDVKLEQHMSETLGIPTLVARLLCNRGLTDIEECQAFLSNDIQNFLDPYELHGMDEAVALIEDTIAQGKHIVVYGDYDVDGITATSVLYRFLVRCGANVNYYIPERQSEGYGLNAEALEQIAAGGTSLVITVDCGISSYDIVETFKDRIDIIITDHHTAPEKIPNAAVVMNPKQPACTYPDKNLSGVGVAYKLCQAMWLGRTGSWFLDYLDIVALGTVADVVPLVGENRIIVKEGLLRMNGHANKGIMALIDVAGLADKEITAGQIGFNLAPRLNAAGRVTHATRAVELLTTDDDTLAKEIAQELQETNTERQLIEREIHDKARIDVMHQGEDASHVLVVAGEGWHSGVIGIVASRLVDEFYKPSLVISIHDGIGKGSCRSIENFDMYDALHSAEDLLIQFGGHKQAAGFSVKEENIPALRRRLTEYAKRNLTDADYIPIVDIDANMLPEEVTISLIQAISELEPYGMGNSTPIFAMTDMTVQQVYLMGQQRKHCKITLQTPKGVLDAIAWNHPEFHQQFFPGSAVKVAFTLQKNEWQGRVSPQLMIQDISLMTEDDPYLTTEKMRDMYVLLRQIFRYPKMPRHVVETEILKLHDDSVSDREAILSIDVCKELDIIEESTDEAGLVIYRWCQVQQKLDLITSLTFLKYSAKGGTL